MTYKTSALALLKEHEGYEQFPYTDSLGILTIGYGRNLQARGLSKNEASYLLEQDIDLAENYLGAYDYYDGLSGYRKAVLIDMMVNMGPSRLAKFVRMHAALLNGDYELAALEMLDSKWAGQVGLRALTLSKVMKEGVL